MALMDSTPSYDANRIAFYNLLKTYGIYHGSNKYRDLMKFLYDPHNTPYLQKYYLLCTGYLFGEELTRRTADLVAELNFVTEGNCTYRELFSMDPEWYDYYKENAYPTGEPKYHYDRRRGVDRSTIEHIMCFKRGPPARSLENAILKECANKVGV